MRSTLARRSATISSGVSVARRRGAGRRQRSAQAPSGRRPGRDRRPRLRPARACPRRPWGWRAGPSRSICATSAATSSSVACTVSTQDGGEVAEVGLGGRALDFEAATPRRARPRAPGAPRGCALPARRTAPRSSCDASSAVRTCSRRSSNVRRSSSSWRSDAAIAVAQLLAARDVPLQLLGARDDALLELARRHPRAAGPRSPARCCARPARRARPWPPRSPATGCAAVSRASNSLRCAADSCSSAARCSVSMRWIDCRASSSRCSCVAQLLFGAAALDGNLLLLARHALGGVARAPSPAARSRRSPFPGGGARPGATRSPTPRAAMATSRPTASSSSRTSVASSASARSRSSLISRLVVRMLRASSRAPPSTRWRAAEDLAVAGHDRARRSRSASAAASSRVAATETSAIRARIASAAGPVRRTSEPAAGQVRARCAATRVTQVLGCPGPSPFADDDEADAAGGALAHELQARGGVGVGAHDDVLQQIAEAGVDGALVLADRPRRSRPPSRAGPPRRRTRPGSIRAPSPYSARAASSSSSDFRRATTPASSCSRVRTSRPSASRLLRATASSDSRAARSTCSVSIASRDAAQRLFGGGALVGGALRFDLQVVALDVELAELLADPRPRRGGMLHGVAQRRRGVDRGVDLAARRLDVGLEPFDGPVGERVRLFLLREHRRPPARARRRRAPPRRGARRARRRAGSRRASSASISAPIDERRGAERLHLLLVERHLLLQPADRQLARVRRFARRRRPRVGLGQLETQPLERRSRPRPGAPPPPASRARASASRPRVASIASPSSAVALRELHLLPAAQLLAQPLVAPRLRRLPLQRAALLLDLEDDVVDAGQVLLRRLELQLRGAAPRLVLRDRRPPPRSAAADRSAARSGSARSCPARSPRRP